MTDKEDVVNNVCSPTPSERESSSLSAKRKRPNSPPSKDLDSSPVAESQEDMSDGEVEPEADGASPKSTTGEAEVNGDTPPLPDEQPPPLPDERPPPLPNEALPYGQPEDDGWGAVWDDTNQAYYFYNRFTQAMQWENPRVPNANQETGPPGVKSAVPAYAKTNTTKSVHPAVAGGYNPAIHGSYDPNADYANVGQSSSSSADTLAYAVAVPDSAQDSSAVDYTAVGTFNRFTGKFQHATLAPENFNDENKSHRQMNAFFDVEKAANSHDGRSLRAERANKKLSKKEVKEFREKRKERKEEKKRAWLRD